MDSLTLSELNLEIKKSLEENLEDSYWVVAEISELKVHQKGHCYLELVEKSDDQIVAKIRATIWSYTYRNLSGWFESITGETLKPGLKILCRVAVNYHEVFGLSLNIKDIDPQYTLGERALRRQEIINRLVEDGVFDMNREIDLPLVPQRVAVIASPTSAGYQDFMEQLRFNEYHYRFEITPFNAIMQGTEAEASIIEALHDIHGKLEDFDLVAILRGGGAALDLECFDSYNLASHVAQFPLPVITGIGHEKDETITDLVAHTKLKTPTAVAEFLIYGMRRFEELVEGFFLEITDYAENTIREQSTRMDRITREIQLRADHLVTHTRNVIQNKEDKLVYTSLARMEEIRTRMVHSISMVQRGTSNLLKHHSVYLDNLGKWLELANPKSILKRGYTITRSRGKVIKSVKELRQGMEIETEFYNGKAKSNIKK